MKDTLAVIQGPANIEYILPVLLELGPEYVTCYCRPNFLEDNSLEAQTLRDHGFVLVPFSSQNDIPPHAFGFADIVGAARALNAPLVASMDRHIYYTHGTDANISPRPRSLMLYSSQRQLAHAMNGAVTACDEDNRPLWAVDVLGGEGVVAGLFHVREWGKKIYRDRELLKKNFAEQLGVTFDPAKPLLMYYNAERIPHPVAMEGLNRLSEYANVVAKCYYVDPPADVNFFAYKENRLSSGAYLPRFAADAVLCGCTSGVFTTSLMLGAHAIPFYTKYLDISGAQGVDGRAGKTINLRSFVPVLSQMPGYWDVLSCVAPLDIQSCDTIMERVTDEAYWRLYDEKIGEVCKAVFGEYYPENGAERAAKYIKNALQFGTFKTPEMARRKPVATSTLPFMKTPCPALL